MDHVSDAFIDNLLPLISLCEPAQNGDIKGVEKVAPQFMQHAASMQKVCKVNIIVCMLTSSHGIFVTIARQMARWYCLTFT